MVSVEIELAKINDWESFHECFAIAMGFPKFYGKNMNAWEDCMLDISRPTTQGMTRVAVPQGEDLVLILSDASEFLEQHMEIFTALLNSTANVNRAKISIPGASKILLLLV